MPTDDDLDALLVPGKQAVQVIPSEEAMVGGAYDAVKRNERMTMLWAPPVQSADMDLLPVKQGLDVRSRDVLRNDAYVRGGATIHQDNIVGALYALNAKPAIRVLPAAFDETWETEFQEEVEERFTLWAESPDNWVDASRQNTFTEMVRLAVGVHTASGEVLNSVEWTRQVYRPFQTMLQFIDTDRLSNPPMKIGDPRLKGGILKDRWGAPSIYYFRMAHQSDWNTNGDNTRWRAVRARKPWGRAQIIHIFEQFRPDQSRGVAEMVSALKEMRMTKNFRDITLQNAVVNATFAAAIESDLPSADVFAQIGGADTVGASLGDQAGSYAQHFLSQVAEYSGGAKNMALDGVKIPHLFPGTKLNLLPAGKGGPLGQEFESSLLRYIAAALGVSYEQLAKDYTKTNYSSARAAMAETWKRMASIKRTVADRYATMIYRLWLEEVINKGVLDTLPSEARETGWLYEAQRLDALSRCDWIGASKGQIDELKETQAAILRLRHGLSTLEIEAGRLGQDWRTLTRQQAREMQVREEFDLPTVTEDNTVNAISGEPRGEGEGD